MAYRGLQHSGLVVSDVDRSRRFYGEVLGLEEVPRPPSFRFGGAWFRVGGDELHLIAESDTTMPAGTVAHGPGLASGLVTHLGIEVDDLAAALAHAAERGAPAASGPMARGDGVDQAYLLDPDGHVIELFEVHGRDQSAAPERVPIRV